MIIIKYIFLVQMCNININININKTINKDKTLDDKKRRNIKIISRN